MENLGKNVGFKFASSNLFASLPLEAEGGSFSSKLSHAAAIVAPVLQLQYPCQADLQACPAFAQQTFHPMVYKTIYCPVLVGSLSEDNMAKSPCLFQISVGTKPIARMPLFEYNPNPLVTTSCL